jgi:hypothetical protein
MHTIFIMPSLRLRRPALLLLCLALNGCLGTVVGTAVDVTLEVAKVPFKVAGAVVDVATPEEDDEDD